MITFNQHFSYNYHCDHCKNNIKKYYTFKKKEKKNANEIEK